MDITFTCVDIDYRAMGAEVPGWVEVASSLCLLLYATGWSLRDWAFVWHWVKLRKDLLAKSLETEYFGGGWTEDVIFAQMF